MKSLPVPMKDMNGGMGTYIPHEEMIFGSEAFADAYIKQSKQLYNFLARKLDGAFRTALRPHLVEGSGQRSVQAIEGDIVTILGVALERDQR
jgi:hypothetical protein